MALNTGILTRPVAFCRVLTFVVILTVVKIRLDSERSSFFVRGNKFTFFTEGLHRSLRI